MRLGYPGTVIKVSQDNIRFDRRFQAAVSLASSNRRTLSIQEGLTTNQKRFISGRLNRTEMLIYALFIYDDKDPIRNQRVYIGKTTRNLDDRMKEHFTTHQTLVDVALHAVDSACTEVPQVACVVLDIAPDSDQLGDLEATYISLFQSFGPGGYNMDGGKKN